MASIKHCMGVFGGSTPESTSPEERQGRDTLSCTPIDMWQGRPEYQVSMGQRHGHSIQRKRKEGSTSRGPAMARGGHTNTGKQDTHIHECLLDSSVAGTKSRRLRLVIIGKEDSERGLTHRSILRHTAHPLGCKAKHPAECQGQGTKEKESVGTYESTECSEHGPARAAAAGGARDWHPLRSEALTKYSGVASATAGMLRGGPAHL